MAVVVYFSHRGENLVNGQLQSLAVGNTEWVARTLAERLACPVVRLVPRVPYSANYAATVAQVKAEQQRNQLPAFQLSTSPAEFETPTRIFLGYPNWNGTLPPVVTAFLKQWSFAGCEILPFCTHEGGGLGNSVALIQQCCPGAKIRTGLPIRGSRVTRSERAVTYWLRQIEISVK
ncbi:flavodoxin [Secundilactobacillus muriivasis]